MHTPETKNQFIILRSQGWSISRIAKRLHVSKPTLIKWNEDYHCVIRSLRALELETLHESILASHKAEVARLSKLQETIAGELSNRKLSDVSTEKLFALDARLRAEIQKIRAAALPIQQHPVPIPLPEHPLIHCGLANTPVEPVPVAFLPEPEPNQSSTEPCPETLQSDSGKEMVNKM